MSTPPDDPDTLAGYDLHAWQPPPPPAGLAGAVVARMRVPVVASGAPARSIRTIVAAAGATLVAAAAIVVVAMTHSPDAPPPPAPVAAVAPAPAPSAPLPAGTPDDDARTRALEKRVIELEVALAKLETLVEELQPAVAKPPVPAPRSVPRPARRPTEIVDPLDPFARREAPEPEPEPEPEDDLTLKDNPFATPHGTPARTPSCDADALVATGTNQLGSGAFAAALSTFESALRCKPGDARITRLAYLAACEAPDLGRARAHYAELAPQERTTVLQICIRNGIDPRDARPPAQIASSTGTLKIASKPTTEIAIDGTDVHQHTPATLNLAPGKHKVTLETGGDKYTWTVIITAGQTFVMNKDLQ